MDPFTRRTGWPDTPNRLALAVEERRAGGLPLHDLTQSNPTRCSFASLADARLLEPLTDRRHLAYEPDPRGLERARQAVCAYHERRGIRIDPGRVFLFSGTSEAYAHLFELLADPGDAVAMPRPSYPLLDQLAALSDVRLAPYRLTPPDWRIEEGALERLRPRPKAVLTIHPNNPTGHYLHAEDRKRLEAYCSADRPAAWISDEVFWEYALDPAQSPPPSSLAAGAAPLVFALGGASKLLGLPQMKVSWAVVSGADQVLVGEAARRLECIADAYLSVSTPAQGALPVWLERSDAITSEILARVRSNRSRLAAALSSCGHARVLDAQAGWCAVIELDGRFDDEDVAVELVRRHGVHVHPGYFYDFEDRARLVVSLLGPGEDFAAASASLAEGLKQIVPAPDAV